MGAAARPVSTATDGGDGAVNRSLRADEGETAVRRITLITRPGCHLCHAARVVVEKVADETGASWQEIDMTHDAELTRLYAEQIPVTLVDGRRHDYWRVDEKRLRAAVAGPPHAR